jgi:hypothetical protein
VRGREREREIGETRTAAQCPPHSRRHDFNFARKGYQTSSRVLPPAGFDAEGSLLGWKKGKRKEKEIAKQIMLRLIYLRALSALRHHPVISRHASEERGEREQPTL